MGINDIVTLINGVGFPVFMCVGMGYYGMKMFTKLSDKIDEGNQLHNEEVKELTKAITELTAYLKKEG